LVWWFWLWKWKTGINGLFPKEISKCWSLRNRIKIGGLLVFA
jgi:hypothetical protein